MHSWNALHGARRCFCRDDVGVYGGFGVVDYMVATGEVRLWYGFDTGNPCVWGELGVFGAGLRLAPEFVIFGVP